MITKQDAIDLLMILQQAQMLGAAAERVVELKTKLKAIAGQMDTPQS